MSTRRKGNRSELKAVKELEADGWRVYRVKGSTKFNKNVDMFNGLFDICAKKGKYTKWIQVKTNRPVPMKPFEEFKYKYCSEYESVEQWVHYDRKGFRKIVVLLI